MLYYAEKLVRLLLLVFSFYGFMQTARRRLDVNLSLAFIFASIGSLMFAAGILNLLPETAAFICLLGCALGVCSIRRRDSVLALVSPGTLFFAVGSVVMAALLLRTKFTSYDNFSHWAIVVKRMLATDRFPNFSDVNIQFQSYPLGSSCFIYYIAKVSGIRFEWMQMLAQAVLMLGMIAALFSCSRRPVTHLLTAVVGVALLAGDIAFTSLLVDTLLPLTALAGLALCVTCRDRLGEQPWLLLPFLLFLMSIKNSGLLFDVVLIVCMLCCGRKALRGHARAFALTALSPFALLLLWQKHVKLVFSDGMHAKHSLSLSLFAATLQEKGADTIDTIASGMLGRVFSLSNPMLHVLLLLLALVLIGRFCLRDRQSPHFLAPLVLGSYAAYELGLFLMYLLTMPTGEALILAGYSRYEKTILIFSAGAVWIYACQLLGRPLSGALRRAASAVLAALCAVSVFTLVKPSLSYFRRQTLCGTTREAYDRLIEDYDIPAGCRYMILRSQNDDGYLFYLTRYLLDPQAVSSAELSWLIELPDLWRDYDYLITLNPSEEIQTYLSEHFELSPVIDLSLYKDEQTASDM